MTCSRIAPALDTNLLRPKGVLRANNLVETLGLNSGGLGTARMSSGPFRAGDRVRYKVGYSFPAQEWEEAIIFHVVESNYGLVERYVLTTPNGSSRWEVFPSEVHSLATPLQRHVTAPLAAQEGGTCYAHAVARVVARFLVIHGIADLTGGKTPQTLYRDIVAKVVDRYGSDGGYPRRVLSWIAGGGGGIIAPQYLPHLVVESFSPYAGGAGASGRMPESVKERIRSILATGR